MTSTYSTNLQIEEPGNGDYPGSWNVPANRNYDLIDQAIAGVYVNATTSTAIDLSAMSAGALANARNAVLVFSGTPSGAVTVTLPSGKSKVYAVRNLTSQTLILTTGAGTTASMSGGEATLCVSDGTNVSRFSARYNSTTDTLSASTIIAGSITGNVTGNVTGSVSAPSGTWTGYTTGNVPSVKLGGANTGLIGDGNNLLFAVAGQGVGYFDSSGNLYARGDVSWSSDASLKTDIARARLGLEQALRIAPATFRRVNQKGRRRELGVIAQDVQRAHPLAVKKQADGTLTVSAAGMQAILLGAIHDLAGQLAEMRQEMRSLKRARRDG